MPVLVMTALLVGGAMLAAPDYSSLESRTGRPEPLPGCHAYSGTVTEAYKVPVLGAEGASFRFEGKVVDGLWRDVRYEVVEIERGLGLVDADLYEDGVPLLPPLFGRTPPRQPVKKQEADLRALASEATPWPQRSPDAARPAVVAATSPKSALALLALPPGEALATPPAPPAADAAAAKVPAPTPAPAPEPTRAPEPGDADGLGWKERLAVRLAIHKAVGEQEALLQAAGLDPGAVEDAAVASALGEPGAEARMQALLASVDPDRVDSAAVLAQLGSAGAAGSPEAAAALAAITDAAAQAQGAGALGELVTAARAEDDAAILAALEAMDREAEEVAAPPAVDPADLARTITVTWDAPTATPAPAPAPAPIKNDETWSQVLGVLDWVESNVEMRQVVPDQLDGRDVWVAERLVDLDRTVTGRERRSGQFVTFDEDLSQVLRWEVRVDHPIQLSEHEDAFGRLKRMDVVLSLDRNGHATSERLGLRYTLGPMRVEVDRTITYGYEGRCDDELAAPAPAR